VPRFMDFGPDLKLPAEAIAQIADDTRHARADQFGVRQLELYHNASGVVYCLVEGPDEQAIRRHHAALGPPAATCTRSRPSPDGGGPAWPGPDEHRPGTGSALHRRPQPFAS
jgi:Nickel responsive protein SCO4226-like